jgi:uncharacterized protein (DUF2147 family)
MKQSERFDAVDIVGIWLTEDKDAKIEIYQNEENLFCGKIVWLEEPNMEDGTIKKDMYNPDPNKRDFPLEGLQLIDGFSFDENKNQWVNGTIYNPEDGKNYYCKMWLKDKDNLKVKGSIDKWSIIGQSQIWSRL